MKKIIIVTLCTLLCLLAILTPLVGVPIIALSLPPQYNETFVGVLDEKIELLEELEGPKIVVVGGSSVAFGLDSELLSSYTGMPVVNFGLYAALGTKLMLDLSSGRVGEGDVVVIAPELDSQTLSLYFNSDTTLRALDGSPEYLRDIPIEHTFSLLSSTWSLATEKLGYIADGNPPRPDGIYRASSFNSFGDVSAKRAENIMLNYYDPQAPVSLCEDILDDEFVDYLNDYIKECRRRGASVYFSFCPVNEMALDDSSDTAEERAEFSTALREALDCPIISEIEEYVLEAGYFYDTNFHLNTAGARKRTLTLAGDLLLELGIPKKVEQPPEAPPLPAFDFRDFEVDENAEYFIYEPLSNGAYMIVGVKDEYKNEKSLTLPRAYNTYKVTQIGASAFAGTALEELIIPSDTSLRYIMNGAFLGAGNLKSLVIHYENEADIKPPDDFVGVASGFKVYVPEGSDYSTGYFWSERGLTFVTIQK